MERWECRGCVGFYPVDYAAVRDALRGALEEHGVDPVDLLALVSWVLDAYSKAVYHLSAVELMGDDLEPAWSGFLLVLGPCNREEEREVPRSIKWYLTRKGMNNLARKVMILCPASERHVIPVEGPSVSFAPESGSLYIRLGEGEAEKTIVSEGSVVLIDVGEEGIIGVEALLSSQAGKELEEALKGTIDKPSS